MMKKRFDVLAAMEHERDQHYVIILNPVNDDVVAPGKASQSGR
jgi:hypothetical protein